MIIRFSRHAKRRVKLYKISESKIRKILEKQDLKEGELIIIEDISGFNYPVKIVVKVESDTMIVITNYPLKKGRKNENTL